MGREHFKRVGTVLATAGRKWDEKFHKPLLWVEAVVVMLFCIGLLAFLGQEHRMHAKIGKRAEIRQVLTNYRTLQFEAVGEWLSAELATRDIHAVLVLGDTDPGNCQVTGLCKRLQRPGITVQMVSPFNYWAGSRSVDDFGIVANVLKDYPDAQLVVDVAAHRYDGRLDQATGGPKLVCFFDTPDLPAELKGGLQAGRLIGAVSLGIEAVSKLIEKKGGAVKVTPEDLSALLGTVPFVFTRESVTKDAGGVARSPIVVSYEVWARQASEGDKGQK
ncbi:MAG: hypothetical protein A3K19_09145 [Lentisphaerae bacterium RIFOXYB12_FULL_65_16]|nr:MAG: hypothetical protein A3K18_14735 [Lentisphaerae bacterium RIFOXYA12_64_32]OGV90351.1 MAG: hypothetical protein A3K19_09145 [Lentisphaerae bacterium RIFOXYB12_FULL_65_16]